MKFWLLTIGEPVPTGASFSDRLLRTGYFAGFLAGNGHDVTWWTSTFDHFRKKHLFLHDKPLQVNSHLRINLLYGGGYKRNVSLGRVRDHRILARKFSAVADQMPKPDIIVSALPTIELSLAAVRFGTKYGIPVVLDMRDMWPDIFVDHSPRMLQPVARFLARPLFNAVRKACTMATAITGITEPFVEWGLRRGSRRRTHLDRAFPMAYISSPMDVEQIKEAEEHWNQRGVTRDRFPFIVCFFGSLNKQLDLESVISAALRLSKIPASRHLFVMCGTGERIEEYRKMSGGCGNIVFPGWVNKSQIYALMRRSAIGLDPLPNRYDFLATINNKAIEYMSAGLPVVSSPEQGVLADLLRGHGCGASYPFGDVERLVRLLLQFADNPALLKDMSARSARTFEKYFRAERVYKEMMDHLVMIAEATPKVA